MRKKRLTKTRILPSKNPLHPHGVHYCGGGYYGHVVKAHGLTFCGLCGREFQEE